MLTAREIEGFGKVTGELIREAVEPLQKRILQLEKDILDARKCFDCDEVARLVIDEMQPELCETITKQVANIPAPRDGIDGKDGRDGIDGVNGDDGRDGKDAEVSQSDIAKAVSDYLSAHPILMPKDGRDGRDGKDGKDGKDASSVARDEIDDAVIEYMKFHQPKDGKDGKDGLDGKDAESITIKEVLPKIKMELQKAVDDLPLPKDGVDGKDGTSVLIDDVLPALQAQVQKAIEALPVPKDGEDGKDGESVTLDDVRSLIESKQAEWALDFEKRAQDILQKAIDRMPKPKDGKDAFSLDDFGVEIGQDGRTVKMWFCAGEQRIERSFIAEWPIYRQIWNKDIDYQKGDTVTFDGSQWTAIQTSKGSRPGQFNSAWKLSVKRGRNGKSFNDN